MSFNKRTISKRGGRFKNNFADNGGIRRSNADSNTLSYAAQLRPVNKSQNVENNISNLPNFYDDPTTLYLLCKYYLGNFIGIKTETEEFNGVLKAVSPNGDFCLTEATVFTHKLEFLSKNEKFKMIPIKDIQIVEVKDIESGFNVDKILIDSEISKMNRSKNGGDKDYNENGCHEIELTPFYDSSVSCDDNCLNANKIGAHWFPPEEMFEKNKTRFNVQSSYSEDLEGYTTKLHKEDPNFQKDLMMAQIKAQEIENDHDHSFNDLENDDEENEELLFSSVSRATESPHRIMTHSGKSKANDLNSRYMPHHHVHRNIESDPLKSPSDPNDHKHNLNPNAREFTPTSSSSTPSYDINNASLQIGSINLQPQAPFTGFIHPSNIMPYPMPVMFPPHHTGHMPMLHNNAIDQYIIPRPNFIPNYQIPPFLIPNQCQIAFDPNVMGFSNKYDCNFPTVVFPSGNDVSFERENSHNDGHNQSLEISEINDDAKKEESENVKKYGDEGARENATSGGVVNDAPFCVVASEQGYEGGDYYQKGPRLYSNPPSYILQDPRTMPPFHPPQIMPGPVPYLPNYFPRPGPPIVHQMLPAAFQMKPMAVGGGGPHYQLINSQGAAFIPAGYGPPPPPQTHHALHHQMHLPGMTPPPQFPHFISPMQPCTYFAPMQAAPPPPPPHTQPPH